ncbi:MAPEG family protein [Gammaproteobacteria bacterium]|nr:MAPEG family protein [Gammaproteobacteria bacterium]
MEITLLYASLMTILAIFLAFRVGINRGKTNTLLGEGDSSELLQSIRSHGNLLENAPLALFLLLLIEMQGVADWKLHLIGSSFFLFRILHAYGLSISRESTPYRVVGALGSWVLMLGMSLYGIYIYLV